MSMQKMNFSSTWVEGGGILVGTFQRCMNPYVDINYSEIDIKGFKSYFMNKIC